MKMERQIQSRSRRRWHVLLLGATALSCTAFPAAADTAVGTGITLGNQLNPTPLLVPQLTRAQDDSPWWSSAWAELGALGNLGNTRAASFQEYGDWNSGVVTHFGFAAQNHETASYVSGAAGGVGRDDQYYELRYGRYGVFDARLSFKSMPHLFANNAKVLWNGAGTGTLTLPSGLTPGASTLAEVSAAHAALFPSKISMSRDKAGFALTYTPRRSWELFFNVSNEWRDGGRPIGASFDFAGRAGIVELVEPTEYRTLEISSGLRFQGEEVLANLTYAGSFFRNEFAALVWEDPGLTNFRSGAYIPTRGQMALPPSNNYHTIKGDFAWVRPKTRFAANVSYSSLRQDEPLLPTIGTGVIGGGIDLGKWNNVGALSQTSANAAIDIINGFANFRFRAADDLNVTFEARYRDENNKTDYVLFNPLTSQYGYIGLDGARTGSIYDPTDEGSKVHIRNIPFATDRFELAAKADYRFADRTKLDVSLTHKEIDRTYREVDHSTDDRVRAQISRTDYGWGTVRLSYEFAARSGGTYSPNPYDAFTSASLPGYIPGTPDGDPPHTLDPFRKYPLADRLEHVFRAQTNVSLSERTDLQFSARYTNDDYDADYGVRSVKAYDLNADLNMQVLSTTSFNLFYGIQANKRDVALINAVRGSSTNGAAGGPIYPLANAWSETVDDINHVFGAGLQHRIDNITIDVNYSYTNANSEFSYAYASAGAFSSALTEAEAGSGFPDQIFEHHLFETNLTWAYQENLTFRWYYRLEHEALEDFHYTGLTNIIDNDIYLGAFPEDYTAHVVGFFTQYRF